MHTTQGCQPKNLRATTPRTGGRPTRQLAGTNPTTGRPRCPCNPALACRPSQSRPFGLVFFFLFARVYVDSLGAVTIMAQKEPVTCGLLVGRAQALLPSRLRVRVRGRLCGCASEHGFPTVWVSPRRKKALVLPLHLG